MKNMNTLTVNGVSYTIEDANAVSFAKAQELTEEQKTRARQNINAVGEKQYELIETITLTEEVASVTRIKDTAGQSYDFSAISVHINAPAANAKTSLGINIGHDTTNLGYVNASGALDTVARQTLCRLYNDHGLVGQYFATANGASSANLFKAPRYHHVLWRNITRINISSGNAESAPIPAGTVITIYAIRG